MPKKLLIFILINAAITFIVGLILLLLGYNIYFNELFYNNAEVYLVFSIITELGYVIVYIIIVVSLWFVYDKRFAKNLAFCLLLGGAYFNNVLKDTFQDPRPWTSRDVTDYGFPSGHSQSAATVYPYLAYNQRKKNKILAWILIGITYLVAISRVIIGVHDIHDIWGGLLFGMFFLTIFIILEPKASEIINTLSLPIKALMIIVIPIILFIIAMLLFPNSDQDYGLWCGAILGLGLGYLVECEWIQYDPSKLTSKQKTINLIIGLLITFALYFALAFIPLESQIWGLIQFSIFTFITVTLIPWIFTKMWK